MHNIIIGLTDDYILNLKQTQEKKMVTLLYVSRMFGQNYLIFLGPHIFCSLLHRICQENIPRAGVLVTGY